MAGVVGGAGHHRDHRERADRHERVDEQIEERRLQPAGGRTPVRDGGRCEPDEDVAGVRDRRVGQHPLHVVLHEGDHAADDE